MSMTSQNPRHRWLPVKLGPADTTLLSLLMAGVALIRAGDYLTGPDAWGGGDTPPSLVGIEQAFPVWIWGIALLIGALIMLGGMTCRNHFAVFFAHCVLAVIYAGLWAGLFVAYAQMEWFDGIRGMAGLSVPVIYCLIVAVRMGARPLDIWKD